MRLVTALTALVLLAACEDDKAKPYLEFAGGGFVFNYRNGDIYYGFVAKPLKHLPDGAVLEARFEVPRSAEPLVMREPADPGKLQYMFKTPDLKGVMPAHDYQVQLVLLDREGGSELARYARTFRTEVDPAQFPDEGLVVGPGYQPNPALPPPKAP